jgi:hypothetical protein
MCATAALTGQVTVRAPGEERQSDPVGVSRLAFEQVFGKLSTEREWFEASSTVGVEF